MDIAVDLFGVWPCESGVWTSPSTHSRCGRGDLAMTPVIFELWNLKLTLRNCGLYVIPFFLLLSIKIVRSIKFGLRFG